MFRTIASLMLFGALSSVGSPPREEQVLLPPIVPPAIAGALQLDEGLTASGAIVIDAESGKEIFSLAADEPRSMGSLTKLMTTIIILEQHDLSEVVTVPASVNQVEGSVARLRPGERYTVSDLLSAALIASANDAAHTLAIYHSGSIERFAKAMNDRAKALGLTHTVFQNPVGFDNPNQHSTPRELAWLAMYALKNETVQSLTKKRSATIRDQSGEHSITLYNTNHLLSSHPSQFFGLKTGTTDLAGQCLISLAYSNGKSYIFVVLHSTDRYRDTLKLFDSLSRAHAYI